MAWIHKAECIQRYLGSGQNELSLRVGNLVLVSEVDRNGDCSLWQGRVVSPQDGLPRGKSGWFPAECVVVVNDAQGGDKPQIVISERNLAYEENELDIDTSQSMGLLHRTHVGVDFNTHESTALRDAEIRAKAEAAAAERVKAVSTTGKKAILKPECLEPSPRSPR